MIPRAMVLIAAMLVVFVVAAWDIRRHYRRWCWWNLRRRMRQFAEATSAITQATMTAGEAFEELVRGINAWTQALDSLIVAAPPLDKNGGENEQ